MVVGVATLLYIFYSQYIIPLSHVYLEDEARYTAVPVKSLTGKHDQRKMIHAWEIWNLDYFRAHGASGTERDEYLPKYVSKDSIPTSLTDDVIWTGKGDASIEIMKSLPDKVKVKISTDHAGMLEFQRFYFPGWGVTVNGKSSSLKIHDRKGTMILKLADGESEVDLTFGYTSLRLISAGISIAFLTVLLVYTALYARRAVAG